MTKMSYEKCYGCPHHDIVYKMVGPFEIICKITGQRLVITECPFIYNDEIEIHEPFYNTKYSKRPPGKIPHPKS